VEKSLGGKMKTRKSVGRVGGEGCGGRGRRDVRGRLPTPLAGRDTHFNRRHQSRSGKLMAAEDRVRVQVG